MSNATASSIKCGNALSSQAKISEVKTKVKSNLRRSLAKTTKPRAKSMRMTETASPFSMQDRTSATLTKSRNSH
uniref:Uncharacterized protein n=1 Tax=Romanomermis culicivorax TaxID=13658 RepID=A0A915I2W5_ROMCU